MIKKINFLYIGNFIQKMDINNIKIFINNRKYRLLEVDSPKKYNKQKLSKMIKKINLYDKEGKESFRNDLVQIMIEMGLKNNVLANQIDSTNQNLHVQISRWRSGISFPSKVSRKRLSDALLEIFDPR